MLRLRPFVIAIALVIALPAVVTADAPPGPYFNGFEDNTAGWFNYSGATVTRVPSGSFSTYANGVGAADGAYYARLGKDPSPAICSSGGGPQPWYVGPYTDWDGDGTAMFPLGGYSTGVDIYLDADYARAHPDTRFDWTSSINDTNGDVRRDFVFNVGTDLLGFVITGGNNSTRCGANPYTIDPAHGPRVSITVSGWYTFRHTFTGVPGGPLVVNLELIQDSTGTVMGSWTRADPTDIIGVTVGGNSYGWFVQNEFQGLAIDNSFRTGIVSTPGCEIKINNGGSITTTFGDRATFGGNARVSLAGVSSGQQTYQDHGPLQPLMFKALSVDAVVCNEARDEAQIYGMGSVDGTGSYQYEIRLTDGGEPGTDDTYGITIATLPAYLSGERTLDGGNVQIR